MTSPHDPDDLHGPVLSEAEEQELTALLAAEGREPLTTPPHVVARLDDVLAGLVAEREHPSDAGADAGSDAGSDVGSDVAAVVPLAGRRRSRRWPPVLLAAAAVVVGGYAVGDLASNGALSGAGSDAGSAAGGSAGSAAEGQLDRRTEDEGDGLAGGGSMSVVPTVRPDHLATDVRRVVRLLGERAVVGDDARPCAVPRLTEGQRFYEVRFRGAPAGMVLGPPEAGSVDVTVYACEDGGVRLSRSVPAP